MQACILRRFPKSQGASGNYFEGTPEGKIPKDIPWRRLIELTDKED